MNCPSCQHDNREGRRFCAQCGASLPLACASCGFGNDPGDLFCGGCGGSLSGGALGGNPATTAAPQPLPDPPPEAPAPSPERPSAEGVPGAGERRHATVLFSDLSGYTAMNEQMDPEEVGAVMGRIKAEAVRIVEGEGGIVNQFVGDEVLALFGIPTAHEDDPLRAVRAARKVHLMVREVSPEVENRIGHPLHMHTGINTGLIVTNLRDSRDGKYGITGDTVNTGARLKSLAGDDEILVSPATQGLIAPFYACDPLESVMMKGKAGLFTPYRVGGESPARSRFDAAEQKGFTPYSGRERELAALGRCLEKTLAGEGQFVTIAAEAGIGKSRLLHEFQQSLQGRDVTVLEGRSQPQGSNTPYLPLLNALRTGLNLGEGDTPQEQLKTTLATLRGIDRGLEDHLPIYLHLLSIPSEAYPILATLQGEELRRSIQLALSALITLSAAKKPLVLLIEDLHWADEASTSALKYLAGVMARTPLMLVSTYRPEYAADWGAPSHLTHIPLQPLDETQSERIVKAVLDADGLPAGLAAVIHERTAGNPFFIEEICHALLEQGTVQVRDVRQAVLTAPLENLTLPESVHAVIRSRLDRLEPDVREVLCLAAVVGREFSARVLERLHPERGLLARCLEQLKALELIQQVRLLPDVGYVFKQVTTQEVAYGTLLLKRRRDLHLQAAEATEELYTSRLSEYSEALARHFRHGEAWAKAARFYLAATQAAKAHYAYRSALDLCAHALRCAEQGEGLEEERGDILILLGDLRSLLGEMDQANARYEEALALSADPDRTRFIENKMHRLGAVQRDGARIVYYEQGTGDQTLFLSRPNAYGIGLFQPIVEQLCQEFRIITMVPRGSGDSDPIVRPYLLSQHMEDVRAVIEATGAAPVNLVGISRSGTLAILLAATYPSLINKLALVCPAVSLPDYEGYIPTGDRLPELKQALEEEDLERTIRLFIPLVISEPGTEELQKQAIDNWRILPEETLYSFFLDRGEDEFVHTRLGEVSSPTLVMQGTEDLRIPFEYSQIVSQRINGCLFYPFEGRGHTPQMTAPGEFCEVLRQFVLEGTIPVSPEVKAVKA